MGFILFPTHRRLKRRKGIHFQRKLKKMMQGYRNGEIPMDQVQASILGWINHVRYGDTWGLREAILQDVIL